MQSNMNRGTGRIVLSLCVAICGLGIGCEEKKEAAPAAAEPAPAVAPATPEPEVKVEPEVEVKKQRPVDIGLELSSERRTAVEAKYADARGFLAAKDLEDKLKENVAVTEKEGALAQFDRLAKDKWVLFSGSMVNLTESGFAMGIVYTPQQPNDPMGMSRQFFEVTFEEVEGYDEKDFKAGSTVVVLAKYQGAGKAGPGHELVALDVWE